MRYAAFIAASLTAGVLFAGAAGPAQAGREDRAPSTSNEYRQSEVPRAEHRKWRRYAYERDARKRYRSSYRYYYPWGPWGPFPGPPGL